MKTYLVDVKELLNRKIFLFSIIITAIICYGYAATNISIGIDDLEGPRYLGDGNVMLLAGRLGMVFWNKIFGFGLDMPYVSYAIDVISVLLLVGAALTFCVLFRRVGGKALVSVPACTAFSCILISYPLINEIWEYTGANLNVCGGYFFVALTALIMHDVIQRRQWKKDRYKFLLASLLMMIVCSSYESLACVYVMIVFMILSMQVVCEEKERQKIKTIVQQGLVYASVLLTGVILRIGCHKLLLAVKSLNAVSNGQTDIMWGKGSFLMILREIYGGIKNLIIESIINFSLTELVICGILALAVVIFLCIRKKSAVLLFPAAGVIFSIFLLTFIQGTLQPYRTCQTFAVFVAFVVLVMIMIVEQLCQSKHRAVKKIVYLCVVLLVVLQSVTLCRFLVINHVRSDEEGNVVRNIGTELERSYDLTKPLIFTGAYDLSEKIQESVCIDQNDFRYQLFKIIDGHFGWRYLTKEIDSVEYRRTVDTNVKSVLTWAIDAFGKQDAMRNLFNYYGYDYLPADFDAVYEKAEEYVNQHHVPEYGKQGYIVDVGDYIIVNL